MSAPPYWGQLPEPNVARDGARRVSTDKNGRYPSPPDYPQSTDAAPRRKSIRPTAPTAVTFDSPSSAAYDVGPGPPRTVLDARANHHDDPSSLPSPASARGPPTNYRHVYANDGLPYAYPNFANAAPPDQQGGMERQRQLGCRHDVQTVPHQRPVQDTSTRRDVVGRDAAAESRPSLNTTTERRRKFAHDRSPLQKLELTLDSMTKEEKRARVEAAEQRARQRAAMRAGEAPASQQAPYHDRTPLAVRENDREANSTTASSSLPAEAPLPVREAAAPRTPPTPPPQLQSHDSINHHHEVHDAAPQQTTRLAQMPVAIGPGIPQRNLSFRERAARNEPTLPDEEISPSSPATADEGLSMVRRGSNKLRKEPPRDAHHRELRGPGTVQGRSRPAAQIFQEPSANLVPLSTRDKELPSVPLPSPDARDPWVPGNNGRIPSWEQAQGLRRLPVEPVHGRDHGSSGEHFSGPIRGQSWDLAQAVQPAQRGAGAISESLGRTGSLQSSSDASRGQQDARFPSKHVEDLRPGAGLYRPPEWMEEWKKGTTGTLSGALLDLKHDQPFAADKNKAWWEGGGRGQGDDRAHMQRRAEAFDGEYDDTNAPTRFKPPLYLKCGPLLRYCGTRRERFPARTPRGDSVISERETWRGSVMIVTEDSESSYEIAPMLRLFVQDVALLPPPPEQVEGELPSEYVDPIAGHPKLGRRGETLYVRPVEHVEEARDVSRDETDNGLFEASRSPPEVPTADGATDLPGSFARRVKSANTDGEKVQQYKDVRGFRLHSERGCTFWRFNIEVELRDKQQRIAYRINRGPCMGFWVPSRARAMNIMFYSGNGFGTGARRDEMSGPDPMWRDVLNTHQTHPFHVMIGGGNQIYNDSVAYECHLLGDWLEMRDPLEKESALFTAEMQDELEAFYLEHYCTWFSQGLYGLATSQIPMVNMYDDHDILDGYGSYPHHDMNGPVFCGLGSVAFKYYMLFQHQSLVTETESSEPSWILGLQPGPYIDELSHSVFLSLGGKMALLAVDCRTERSENNVTREKTWEKIMNRLYAEIRRGQIEHLLVLSALPIAYPRFDWFESFFASKLMSPVKALGRKGVFGKSLNNFEGRAELQDDVNGHWVAKNHKHERSIIIEDLQDLAIDKSMRITILSGNVGMAAVGQFYSNPKLGLAKHRDPRYMPNIISSAVANAPPSDLMADALSKRSKVHHFDKQTDEAMIPLFQEGTDGKGRGNKHLLPHRNWCSIRQWTPGTTPPPTPPLSACDASRSPEHGAGGGILRRLSSRRSAKPNRLDGGRESLRGSRPPVSGRTGLFRSLSRRSSTDKQRPGILSRTMSLGRGEAGARSHAEPGHHISESRLDKGGVDDYASGSPRAAHHGGGHGAGAAQDEYAAGDEAQFSAMPSFHRTPTGLSAKQMRQADKYKVDLEGGLDIRLNVEVNAQDPAGITVPYRMLVPRLQYEYNPAEDDLAQKGAEMSGIKRLLSFRKKGARAKSDDYEDEEMSDEDSEEYPAQ